MLCLCTFSSLLFNFQGSPAASTAAFLLYPNRFALSSTFLKFLKISFSPLLGSSLRSRAVELQFIKLFLDCQPFFCKKMTIYFLFHRCSHFLPFCEKNPFFPSFYIIYSLNLLKKTAPFFSNGTAFHAFYFQSVCKSFVPSSMKSSATPAL